MKTQNEFKNITALFMALCFIAISFSSTDAHAKRKKKFKGIIIVNQILKLSGTIMVNENPVPEYSGIKEGDTLETGEKSFAVIRIPGLAIYRMGPQTKIKLTKFSNRDNSRIDLFKGDLLAVYKRLGNHDIKFPHGTIQPEGNTQSSTFYISATADEEAASIWEGKLVLKSTASSIQAPPQEKKEAKPTAVAAASPTPAASPNTSPAAAPITTAAQTIPTAPSAQTLAVPPAVAIQLEKTVVAKQEYRGFLFNNQGIKEKEETVLSNLPDSKIIHELESLYALP